MNPFEFFLWTVAVSAGAFVLIVALGLGFRICRFLGERW